uniref:Amino acid permease/ SLC12A domain-containing protein n=1 Tax=Acrobeloides nanus TaxID=290746 RepID=A0A914EHC8_9BILA
MVNIFGIVIFLRMGWIVGTAGIAHAVLLLIICTALALITVFSAIGICDRCRIEAGGIYSLISHVLGGQIGGAVGLLYAFGQAVATGLVAVGFGESMARLFNTESSGAIKLISITTLILLSGINAAGVRWVIRLQLVLLAFLALALFDFILGAFFTYDPEDGVGKFSSERFSINSAPHYEGANCSNFGHNTYTKDQSFFSVFGVFFANFLGVLAGVNMASDLKNPHKSIPLGELSAIGVSSTTCFIFILILGSIVDREFLLCNYMINERVSLTKVMFLTGLYISSLSSIIGSLLGTPRVIQGIAAEGIIPVLAPLSKGEGPNKNPVRAAMVLMGVAIVFALLGDLNQLAILSTMPFLITYGFVNYAYVSLAMSYDLKAVHEETKKAIRRKSYGSTVSVSEPAETPKSNTVLDDLFPERKAEDGDPSEIYSQPTSWYAIFSNRYISFVGAIVNLTILIFINPMFAMLHFMAFAMIYYYIGRAFPAVSQGVTLFSLTHMFKTVWSKAETLIETDKQGLIIDSGNIGYDVSTARLNEENPDYSTRKPYHHTKEVRDFD